MGEFNELEKLKKEFKENFQLLIENGMIKETKLAVEEYESIVKDDIDIYSIKAVIAMMEGDMDGAEKILRDGIAIDEANYDMLYNYAFFYQSSNQKEMAIEYYKKALQNANNENDVDEVYEILQGLGIKESKQYIIDNTVYDMYYGRATKLENMGNRSDAALYYGFAYRNTKEDNLKNKLLSLYRDSAALSDIFNVAASTTQRRFIILSSCGWGDIYQRMHHIARSLAKYGHEVIYITPSTSANVNSENISISDLTKHSLKNLKIVDNVKIYSPILAMHNQKQVHNNYTDLVQNLLNVYTNSSQTIIITYMPYQIQVLNSLNGDYMHIYECVDDHSDLEYAFWGTKKDIIWEQELMDRADAITTTATSLFLQRRVIENRENVYLSRNAVNEADFIFDDERIPEDLKGIPEPRIAYIGAIYEWFDTALFYEIVKSNPEKSFVVIGFGKEGILNKKCPNLYIIGAKSHRELKRYLRHMDIGIIPFRADTDIIINCDPIKHYEYIACGLPVITTFMPESSMNKIYTYLADTKESFNEAIEKCLDLTVDNDIISNFLVENSWNARAALLCRIADRDVSKAEREKEIKYIGTTLDNILSKYESPIFKTLSAVYTNLEDENKFEILTKQAYNSDKLKYIEKQYLTALLRNKNISVFIDVVSNSSNVKEEIKQELLYCQMENKLDCIDIIAHICVGDIRTAITLMSTMSDESIKTLYKRYISNMLGEEIRHQELESISESKKKSPLLIFLEEKYKYKKNVSAANGSSSFVSEEISFKHPKGIILSGNTVKFSIMVPVRNAEEVLKPALLTCLEQDYQGSYEIVISDNSTPGNNNTYEIIKELNSSKIKYLRTDGSLQIEENFENALNNTRGDYVMCMGGDDGVLLHSLRYLDFVTNQLPNEDIFHWNMVAYGWPGIILDHYADKMCIPGVQYKDKCTFNYLDSKTILEGVASFKYRFTSLPILYNSALVSRRILNELKQKYGKLFAIAPQDVWSGVSLLTLRSKFVHLNTFLGIGGTSKRSGGAIAETIKLHAYNEIQDNRNTKNDINDFFKINRNKLMFRSKYLPNFFTEQSTVVEVFLYMIENKTLEYEWFTKINWKYLFDVWISAVMIDDSPQLFKLKMEDILEKVRLHNNRDWENWFLNNYYKNTEFKGFTKVSNVSMVDGFKEDGGYIISPSKFGYKDVYGAAKLFSKIYNM